MGTARGFDRLVFFTDAVTTSLYGVGSNAVALVLALVIGVAFPQINYYALLLLVLTIPLDWIVKPRLHARIRSTADRPRG
jgi:hypothetical protein